MCDGAYSFWAFGAAALAALALIAAPLALAHVLRAASAAFALTQPKARPLSPRMSCRPHESRTPSATAGAKVHTSVGRRVRTDDRALGLVDGGAKPARGACVGSAAGASAQGGYCGAPSPLAHNVVAATSVAQLARCACAGGCHSRRGRADGGGYRVLLDARGRARGALRRTAVRIAKRRARGAGIAGGVAPAGGLGDVRQPPRRGGPSWRGWHRLRVRHDRCACRCGACAAAQAPGLGSCARVVSDN